MAPRRARKRKSSANPDAAAAVRNFLVALGVEVREDLDDTPERVALLWSEHLLGGQGKNPERSLGKGTRSRATGPVTVFDLGVHLVCPHHLTVAFGQAHLAYEPNGRVAGFGALSRLVEDCTARLVLQEEAAADITRVLVQQLDAHAAVVCIDAVHPCHNIQRPRSHKARIVTWGSSGDPARIRQLRRILRRPLA